MTEWYNESLRIHGEIKKYNDDLDMMRRDRGISFIGEILENKSVITSVEVEKTGQSKFEVTIRIDTHKED